MTKQVAVRRIPWGVWSSGLLLGLVALLGAPKSHAQTSDWRWGAYAGQYYDTEPAGFIGGRAGFVDHYLVALTANKTLWQSARWPLALEVDAMVGQQRGVASLTEVAVAPAVRWSGFPWNHKLHTSFRAAPLGISHTSAVSPLERGPTGEGSRTLNWLFLELAVARPQNKDNEVFMRLHHRCNIYDLLNNHGANGDDFFTIGFRRRF